MAEKVKTILTPRKPRAKKVDPKPMPKPVPVEPAVTFGGRKARRRAEEADLLGELRDGRAMPAKLLDKTLPWWRDAAVRLERRGKVAIRMGGTCRDESVQIVPEKPADDGPAARNAADRLGKSARK